jgi:hypothetical protein
MMTAPPKIVSNAQIFGLVLFAQLARGYTEFAMPEVAKLFQCTLRGRQAATFKARLRTTAPIPGDKMIALSTPG